MKKVLLFVLSLFLFSFTPSQNDYEINIFGKGGHGQWQFKIAINRHENKTEIVYSKYEYSNPFPEKVKEDLTSKLSKSSTLTDSEKKELLDLVAKYEVYTNDSLTISNNKSIIGLLDSIYAKGKNGELELEDKRIHIDTPSFSIFIKDRYSSFEKMIYISSPTIDSHPLLYQLIANSLELYRNTSAEPILQKEDTGGY